MIAGGANSCGRCRSGIPFPPVIIGCIPSPTTVYGSWVECTTCGPASVLKFFSEWRDVGRQFVVAATDPSRPHITTRTAVANVEIVGRATIQPVQRMVTAVVRPPEPATGVNPTGPYSILKGRSARCPGESTELEET